jgi:hypothetical protein
MHNTRPLLTDKARPNSRGHVAKSPLGDLLKLRTVFFWKGGRVRISACQQTVLCCNKSILQRSGSVREQQVRVAEPRDPRD